MDLTSTFKILFKSSRLYRLICRNRLKCSLCGEQACVQMQIVLFLSLQWYSINQLPVQYVISFLPPNLTVVFTVMASVITNKAISLLIFISILQGKQSIIYLQAFSRFFCLLCFLQI